MADKKKEKARAKRMWMVDPIYRKFTAKAFQNLTSPEFYSFFTEMLRNGEHTFQFSNRKLDMRVDEKWVDIIEATIPHFYEISRNPRVVITQEELVTNVVQARKIDSQVVKHLCAHSYLVESFDDETNEVTPEKVLNIFKEETWNTYENRFVYTLLVKAYDFVAKRYRDMQEYMNDEFGATLKIDSSALSSMESMKIKSEMKINQIDDFFDTQSKDNIFARIKKLYYDLNTLMNSRFAKVMIKFSRVYPPLVPTNAIKKNPHLKACHKLWDFLLSYMDVGYSVNIIEQNPEINEKFEQDIFNNIMFTYIILKGYLEDNRDRALDRNVKSRRTTLKPKYIKEIVEEFVKDFNLPDVEVRKILIEELTKEQLMREEREERYRIVEERQKEIERKRRQEERERQQREKEEAREAARLAREKERARVRREKELAEAKIRREKEKVKKAAADARRTELISKELETVFASIERRRKAG